MRGRYERVPEKKPKRGKKILLIVLAVLLVIIIGVIIAGVVYYNSMLDKITKVEVPKIEYTQSTFATEATEDASATEDTTPTVTTEPPHVPSSADYLNILVVGQSAREDETARHADSMILCTYNTYENTLTLTSMLRDAYTVIPRYTDKHGVAHDGKTKLTNIYHLGSYWNDGDIAGSMEVMNRALYHNFGIEVDYNFEINFDMFITFIDKLHGVHINLTQEESDYLNKMRDKGWFGYTTQPGWFNLDGSGALCYARMRKAEGDADSDIKRTARQRHLIEQLIVRARELPLSEVQESINSILPMVITSMSNTEITDLLLTMLPKLATLKFNTGGTCPVQGTYSGTVKDIYKDGGSHSILEFDIGQNTKLIRAITEGEGVVPTQPAS